MIMTIVTQAIGFLATLLLFLTYQFNDKRIILTFHIAISVCMTLHYGLLGAMSGMIINVICLIRNILFYFDEKVKRTDNVVLLVIIVLGEIIATIAFWGGTTDFLALIGAPLQTVALWVKNTRTVRVLMLIASPLWLIYDFCIGSWAGIVTESIVICSIIIGIWKFDNDIIN